MVPPPTLAPPSSSAPFPPPAARPGWRALLPAAVIVAAALAAYWNSLAGPFVFDDLPAIVDNPTIRSLARVDVVLTPPGDGSTVTGRPLLNLTFALNHAWGGLNPWGYHVFNLAVHTLAALALFGLVRRTLLQPRLRDRYAPSATALAAATAVLWAVHPLQTESVTFVVQRAESLMGLCYLATLYFFSRAVEKPAAGSVAMTLSVGCCALGMAAKEVMATAPLMVLLYDRTFVAGTFRGALRTRGRFYGALAATWLPLLWLVTRGGGTRGVSAGLGLGVSSWSYALRQCEAIVHYLRLVVWPSPLVLDYGTDVVTAFRTVAPQAGLLVALATGTLVALRRWPGLGFLGTWFLVILAPSSSFVPVIGQTAAEHRMYLPLAALLAALVLGLFRLLGKGSIPACVILALVWGGFTVRRNRDYGGAVGLWRDTVIKRPGNYRAHYNLAVELAQTPAGKAEAIAEYERSIELEPSYAEAHNNLAIELTQAPGRESEALAHYAEALRLRPDFPDAHYNLALALGRHPDRAVEAVAHYETALRLRPDYAEAHNNLAVELARLPGRLPDAVAHYEAALRLRPGYAEAHYGLANALAGTAGRGADALAHYEAALRLRPDYADAHFALAVVLAQMPGRAAEVEAHYEAAVQFNPNHIQAHYNLANELAKDPQRLADAISHYEAAVRLNPDFLEARNNLAGAYYRSGRLDEAIRQLTEVLRLNPESTNARRNLEMLKHQRPQ